jgi:hypothetical protein
MKRIGNIYHKIYDMDNLRLAHLNARKDKGSYAEVQMVDSDIEHYLQELQMSLINKTYKTSEYTIFEKIEGRKVRTLYKLPYYPDRICQWAIMQILEPILIKTLIYDTYSALPGRGPHLAWKRINKAMYHKNDTKYCLKIDIHKYYPSISHDILKQIYRRKIKDNDVLWLIDEIIDSVPSGIPIGNYFSQWSGNLYLSGFDHWCKEEKKCRFYFRYMDDIVIFHKSKRFLHQLDDEIREYLARNLKLRVKSNRQVFKTRSRGLDYVGYRFFDENILLRKSTAKTLKTKMIKIKKTCESGLDLTLNEYCSINSYRGWIKWCNHHKLEQKYIKPLQPYIDKFNNEVKEKCV